MDEINSEILRLSHYLTPEQREGFLGLLRLMCEGVPEQTLADLASASEGDD